MTITLDLEWPATLPLPVINFAGQPRNATIFSPETSYLITRRSRFVTPYGQLAVNFVFNMLQYEIFKSFWRDDLGNGTAQFKMELRYPKNSGLNEWAVRFSTRYEATLTDNFWTVSVSLDVIGPAGEVQIIT